jgi:rhamnose utilization protein RhaD (predicted bifunctional aldolase and dehydrogenase)
MSLAELTAVSRLYGANRDYVIAGGGNTSWKDKDGDALYVKGSGTSLADITAEGFVKMRRPLLAAIWEKYYPEDSAEREAAVLLDMMNARFPGEEKKRPSVETLLHDLLPFRFVVHTHPALVNGVTCSVEGEATVRRLFGGLAAPPVWIPLIDPGYVLAAAVKKELDTYRAHYGTPPQVIFLQNHGIFAASDTVAGVDEIYRSIMETIGKAVHRQPDSGGGAGGEPSEIASALSAAFCAHFPDGVKTAFAASNELLRLTENRAAFHPVSSAFTPDHIVYAGSDPLFIERSGGGQPWTAAVEPALKAHVARTGRPPKTVAVEGYGVFGVGASVKAAQLAVDLFEDAARVAAYTESFGGPRFMTREKIDFINNWEVERYRSNVSAK